MFLLLMECPLLIDNIFLMCHSLSPAVQRDGPGGDLVIPLPAQFLHSWPSECTAFSLCLNLCACRKKQNNNVRSLRFKIFLLSFLSFFLFSMIMCCLCVSGLLSGGHERVITHLPAAPAGVWTCLSEEGKALGWNRWIDRCEYFPNARYNIYYFFAFC